MSRLVLASVLLLSGCQWVSFGRRVTDDELRLKAEIRAVYPGARRVEFLALGFHKALVEVEHRSRAKTRDRLERRKGRWTVVEAEPLEGPAS